MVQIKMDHVDTIGKLLTPKKPNAQSEPRSAASETDVTVDVRNLAGMVVADNSSEDNARVLEMKQKIDSNSYRVDTSALATKLFEQVFSKTIG